MKKLAGENTPAYFNPKKSFITLTIGRRTLLQLNCVRKRCNLEQQQPPALIVFLTASSKLSLVLKA
jgi:hypothetical protein